MRIFWDDYRTFCSLKKPTYVSCAHNCRNYSRFSCCSGEMPKQNEEEVDESQGELNRRTRICYLLFKKIQICAFKELLKLALYQIFTSYVVDFLMQSVHAWIVVYHNLVKHMPSLSPTAAKGLRTLLGFSLWTKKAVAFAFFCWLLQGNGYIAVFSCLFLGRIAVLHT